VDTVSRIEHNRQHGEIPVAVAEVVFQMITVLFGSLDNESEAG
jgi:hypothetical protein